MGRPVVLGCVTVSVSVRPASPGAGGALIPLPVRELFLRAP